MHQNVFGLHAALSEPLDGFEQESTAVAREDALLPIHFLLQYRPSRSSKV